MLSIRIKEWKPKINSLMNHFLNTSLTNGTVTRFFFFSGEGYLSLKLEGYDVFYGRHSIIFFVSNTNDKN